MAPLAAACGLTILVAACSDASSAAASEPAAGQTASPSQPAEPQALVMPVVEAGTMPGVLTGSIGTEPLSLEGTCSMGSDNFEFWSDGKAFAVGRDTNGDGMYLNIMVRKTGSKTMSALSYNRGGEMVYNGIFSPSSYDGTVLSTDTTLGSQAAIPAKFEVRCNR